MSQENVALVRGLYAAFATGDVPGVLGAMSPDIVWNEAENFPYADGNPMSGRWRWRRACSRGWAANGTVSP